MDILYTQVAEQLSALEADLKQLQIWEAAPPTAEQLASQQPFCIDTLSFSQWLQFVFLVRMQQLVEARQPLPERCGIAPMAEEYFKTMALDARDLIRRLETIDQILSQQ